MIATFELTKADLEEAVTDYINKVLQPNVSYDLGDLSVTFKVDDLAWIHRRVSGVDRVVTGQMPSELG